MSFVQFFVPAEVAHDTIAELGELGNVQFKDVSNRINQQCTFCLFVLQFVLIVES